MNALERAKSDLQAGNYGLARQRLESYVGAKGYDPELMARIGQLCFDMHDPFNAGRMWIVSAAQGEHVERAIDAFMSVSGRDCRQAAFMILSAARLPAISDYPIGVQGRLRNRGLDVAIVNACRCKKAAAPNQRTFVKRIAGVVFVAVLLAFVGSCIVGVKTIFSWAF